MVDKQNTWGWVGCTSRGRRLCRVSSLPIGYRSGERRAPRSPAQIAALVIGVWWTTNGIGAFFVDPNLATRHVHGSRELFGLAITANGWHALFHLLPGLVGIAAARRPRPALVYTLAAGAVYITVGGWGLIVGGDSIGIIAVDTPGDLVHLIEGLLTLTAGILTLALQLRPVRSS
jgi:hypothetical protein